MLLSVTATSTSSEAPATDLGFLLHKHPDRVQSFELPVGTAHVFYPEATTSRCTVTLLLDVDPVGLVRGKRFSGEGSALSQYVNDRPYAASSLLAVALGRVFGTALKGRCEARPDLPSAMISLDIHVPSLPADGGVASIERLFAPLGWRVSATAQPLDPTVAAWGGSRYCDVHLSGTMTLQNALSHLYVLLPVLDGSKHYWVGSEEVDKLVRAGGSWLPDHPERDQIMHRYLARQRAYVTDATERLTALDDRTPDRRPGDAPPRAETDSGTEPDARTEPETGTPSVSLAGLRKAAVLAQLTRLGAKRVVDLGCGEGALLRELVTDPSFTEVVGVDVSAGALERASRRLGLERMPDSQRARLSLLQSSATYRDSRLEGYDAVVLMEVIEHVDEDRLPALERSVFARAAPASVVVTTPNAECNVLYPHLAAGTMRHPDHRFEWDREGFARWAVRVAEDHGYAVDLHPVGEEDPELGSPTQMAVFTRRMTNGVLP